MEKKYILICNIGKLEFFQKELLYDYIDQNSLDVYDIYEEDIVQKQENDFEIIKNIVRSEIEFGKELILEFTAENVALGITQAGMTSTIIERTKDVFISLERGSLYDAIIKMKSFPDDLKDTLYITNDRILKFINKIEKHLNIALTTNI
jgi:hypothetical protein